MTLHYGQSRLILEGFYDLCNCVRTEGSSTVNSNYKVNLFSDEDKFFNLANVSPSMALWWECCTGNVTVFYCTETRWVLNGPSTVIETVKM